MGRGQDGREWGRKGELMRQPWVCEHVQEKSGKGLETEEGRRSKMRVERRSEQGEGEQRRDLDREE